MKKIALTSLLALFVVSSAQAATNYFVGGAATLEMGNDHNTVLGIAPEFGWKLNSDWDMGVMADFGYTHKDTIDVPGATDVNVETYSYGAGAFARYKVAQFGGVKLLLKGMAGVDFDTYHHEKEAVGDEDKTETAVSIGAAVIPMITYDISESFTLYANLNFLGVYAGYDFKNKDLGIDKGWGIGAYADSDNVANTKEFQIGFNYNF